MVDVKKAYSNFKKTFPNREVVKCYEYDDGYLFIMKTNSNLQNWVFADKQEGLIRIVRMSVRFKNGKDVTDQL